MKQIFILAFLVFTISCFGQFSGPITTKNKIKLPEPPTIPGQPTIYKEPQTNTNNKLSCSEIMNMVKSDAYGTTYYSYNSDAISKVTFYDIEIDYEVYYFAIVCFNNKNSIGCREYIYRVSSNTEANYSSHYLNSAGQAFWKYIQPYNKYLGCGI